MEKLVKGSCETFTELIASKAPAPGGGGAAALVASIGIALGDMVGEFTVGKKAYAEVEEEMCALMDRAQALRIRLLELVDEDAENFEPLSRAYGIPKDDPGRDAVMESCLRQAAAAPMEIFDLACESIELQKAFAGKGSKIMISDAATGVAFGCAAMYGAAVNVKANTKLMKDRAFAGEMDRHVDEALVRYKRLAEEVFESVYGKLTGSGR